MLLFDSLSTGRFVCLHSSGYTHLKGVNISAALDKHGFGPPAFSSLMSCFVALVYSIHPSFLSFFSCLFFFFLADALRSSHHLLIIFLFIYFVKLPNGESGVGSVRLFGSARVQSAVLLTQERQQQSVLSWQCAVVHLSCSHLFSLFFKYLCTCIYIFIYTSWCFLIQCCCCCASRQFLFFFFSFFFYLL